MRKAYKTIEKTKNDYILTQRIASAFWRNEPSKNTIDHINDVWEKNGREYKRLKENDTSYCDLLVYGFVETNGSLPWTVIFSELELEQKYKYLPFSGYCNFDSECLNGNRQEEWFQETLTAYSVKGFLMLIEALQYGKAYIHSKSCYGYHARTGDSNGRPWIHYDEEHVLPHINNQELLDIKCINMGISESRDYTSLGQACYRLICDFADVPQCVFFDDIQENQSKYHIVTGWESDFDRDSVAKYIRGNGPTIEYMRSNWVDFVEWIVKCENEAQKYANYARRHPPENVLRAIYEHEFSEESMQKICNGPIAYVYYMGKEKKFDFYNVKRKRAFIFGENSECPV